MMPLHDGSFSDASIAVLMANVRERWKFEECEFDAIEQMLKDPFMVGLLRAMLAVTPWPGTQTR